MNRHNYLLLFLIGLTLCSYQTNKESLFIKGVDSNDASCAEKSKQANTATLLTQTDLTKIYSQAITVFIKAAFRKNKTKFDTLYFGKHVYGQADDFPDIKLPLTIEETQIRLVSPEVGQKKMAEQKSLVFINLMAWMSNDTAEFIFIVFCHGAVHQYDYIIHFTKRGANKEFDLDKIAYESYLNLNGQKPKRITLFEQGRYLE